MLDLYVKIILYHVLNVVKIFELLSKVKSQILQTSHFAGGGSNIGRSGQEEKMGKTVQVGSGLDAPLLKLSLKSLLFSLTLTSSIQARWEFVQMFPPEIILHWPVNLWR